MRWLLALLLAALPAASAVAEVGEIRIARQYGIGYLPLMLMEHEGLIQKRAALAGVGVKVSWLTLSNPGAMNDALLTNAIDFVAVGPPGFLTLWAKSRGTDLAVKGVSAMSALSMFLNTSNPNVRSIADFTETDRIALPGIKVANAAIMLQTASAALWGMRDYARLDHLTVTLSHPDAVTALLSPRSEITAHFASPPFQGIELKDPRIHTVTTTNDIMGGPSTFTMIVARETFQKGNPKILESFLGAMDDAIASIKADPAAAARIYAEVSGDRKSTQADLEAVLADPAVTFTTVPQKIMAVSNFMAEAGLIKVKPTSWKELFPAALQSLPGT